MPKTLDLNTIQEIDYSAILDQYVYSDDQNIAYKGKTISEIIDISTTQNTPLKNNSTLIDAINKNPEIGEFVLVSQSSCEPHSRTGENFSMNHIIACTFKNPKTNDIYVAYRGTGDGKWVDNGDGMSAESSLMQRAAADYFDSVVLSERLNTEYSGKIIVTGHSKGGNSAQFVTMYAQNSHLIDNCYSIDGQGFSLKASEAFKTKWKENYQAQIDKMYSINGQNDYVHDLGKTIINEDQTYFIKTRGNDFGSWHALSKMFSDGNFNWAYTIDENGNKVYDFNVSQGHIGKFAKELSANMMALNEEELDDCAITIMSALEFFMGNDATGENSKIGTGDRTTLTIEEFFGFLGNGLPLIVNTAINSGETQYILESFNIDQCFFDLLSEVQLFAKNKGIEDFCGYISEDPIRLLEVYMSLDLSKKTVNDAVVKILSAGVVGKLLLTALFPNVAVMVDIAAAIGIVYLVANHIHKNWDVICDNVKMAAEQVKDEIVHFYNEAKTAVETGINNWVSSVCSKAEEYITKGERVVNKLIDSATDFWNIFKEQTVNAVKRQLFISNPLLYIIASKVYRAVDEPVRINIHEISDCVDRMNRLAKRVAKIDQRLDDLYWHLAQNNIEQDEGLFTSLANIYNLFRADLNVDEGATIKRKARALTDLYDGYKRTDEWVLEHVPKKI